MTESVAKIIEAYGAAWLEEDAARRLALLEFCWSDYGIYQDPTADVTGRDALCGHIGACQAERPDLKVILTSGADAHHRKVRFTWKLVDTDGNQLRDGVDFGELDEYGRLAKIIGFFGPAPLNLLADRPRHHPSALRDQ